MTSPSPSPQKATLQRLWRYCQPNAHGLYASLFFFVLMSVTEPMIPAFFKMVLDEGMSSQAGALPVWMVTGALVGLFAARGLFSFCASYCMSWFTSHAVLRVRADLVQALLRADAKLYNDMTPGLAVAKTVNQPQDAMGMLAGAATTLLRDGGTVVAMTGYLLYLNWQLTSLFLVTLPVIAYCVKHIHHRIMRIAGDSYESTMRLVQIVDDIARAWRIVRTFDAQHWEGARFVNEAQRSRAITVKSAAASAMMSPTSQLVASIGLAAILWLGLVQAQTQGSTPGDFIAFITGMLLLVPKARPLADLAQPVIGGLVVARGFFELMDSDPEPDQGTRHLEHARGNLQFQEVSLRYPGAEQKAIDRLSLNVVAGTTVAFVGPSGSGKTTLTNALLGFLHPNEGRITLDGVDITEIRKSSLRSQFAVVSQDTVLFDATIAENIIYTQDRDEAKLRECLQAANLVTFVDSLPQGVNTRIGANGGRLSGGQRQRIAIARALYKDTPIWIFDEATSALDSASEAEVQEAIERWYGQKTLVIIAHRLSTIRNADCIHVLSNGRLSESGNHHELMARRGMYCTMVEAQMGARE